LSAKVLVRRSYSRLPINTEGQAMSVFRWIALALLTVGLVSGCSNNPDTDPKDEELNVPNIEEGDSAKPPMATS
jgi:hypothetical protein